MLLTKAKETPITEREKGLSSSPNASKTGTQLKPALLDKWNKILGGVAV